MAKKAAKPDLQLVVDNTPDAAQATDKPAAPEQVEMPFAIVNGEAITQLPKDLYIPPQALEVFLDAFEGPLDLLLYMIRRQNLDILDIPIADITRQYMEYIELMADLQLDIAGEYLVMAATLAEIKSRMLLPRAVDPNAGEEGDPRADLVRRLQEYERFKSAAESIDRMPRLDRDTWVASADLLERKSSRPLPQTAVHASRFRSNSRSARPGKARSKAHVRFRTAAGSSRSAPREMPRHIAPRSSARWFSGR